MVDLNRCQRHVERAVQAAHGILLEGFRSRPRATLKSSEIDFVTEYDRRSEIVIKEALAPLGLAIVGEESGGTPADYTFFVDPLDGTTNYLHGHPFFAISIGLCAADVPVLGVVHAPALGVTWSAIRGRGATRNQELCRVTDTARLEDALLATGFPYDRRESDADNLYEFIRLKKVTRGVRRCGSAAIDVCMVADGTYDGYWEMKLNPWDWAAATCILHEAGGTSSRYDGSAFDVREPREGLRRTELVASNGHVHAAILAELNDTSE